MKNWILQQVIKYFYLKLSLPEEQIPLPDMKFQEIVETDRKRRTI